MKTDPKYLELSARVVEIATQVKVLGPLSWPPSAEAEFLSGRRRGQVVLPRIEYPRIDHGEFIAELERVMAALDESEPAHRLLRETARSYRDACRMLHAIGTPRFTELSIEIYGRPSEVMPGSTLTHVEAASRFIAAANAFPALGAAIYETSYSGEEIAAYLREGIEKVFGDEGPPVEMASDLTAKAAASGDRVRVREGAVFTRYDFDQLLQHEVLIHTLTSINGRAQMNVPCLSLGAPRTTKTQEGLATFAEWATGSIDLVRIKRLALRVLAVENALNGANFFELFEFFLEFGQNERESYRSAERIFRGGQPDGTGVLFTKDAVYLDGLIKVHSLVRWALESGQFDLIELLFCGRLAIEDIFALRALYSEGVVLAPRYKPRWYEKVHSLAGLMALTMVATEIDIDHVEAYLKHGCH
ncbi:MAG: DUF1704 domain-containing protein [Chrysiogenetes bacterium]|nr:DUF1704 domain-containing protein [Chrysiogenetes bacterium]